MLRLRLGLQDISEIGYMKLAKHPTFFKTVVAALLLLALVACGSAATAMPKPTVASTATIAPTAVPAVTPNSTKAPEPTAPTPTAVPRTPRVASLSLTQALAPLSMDYEGEGTQETEQFIVSKGVMIMMANYEGDGKFKVTIITDDQEMEPSIDVVGPYFGNMLYTAFRGNTEGLTTGGHTIKVDADGPWRIQLFQDFPSTGQEPTIQFGGVGDGGGGWMQLEEGEYTIRASHDGESHFQVRLHESRGTPEVLVIDEDGAFDETVSITVSEDPSVSNIAPGVYGIGVLSDGIWSLIIEDPDNPAN